MSISFCPMKSEINNENALALFINLALVDIDTRENVIDDVKYIFIINFGFHGTEIDIGITASPRLSR